MNLERIKLAIKNRELFGLEPYYILKAIVERKQSNGWGIGIFYFHFYLLLFR